MLLKLRRCYFRDWQRRRVVFSSEVVGFAKLCDEVMVDSIKMAEIEAVNEIEPENQNKHGFAALFNFGKRKSETKQRTSTISEDKLNLFCNSLRIETSVDGGNSGRTYYLQCDSKEGVKETVQTLKSLVKIAGLQSIRVTCIPMSQKWVRKCLHSNIFKTLSALVIVAVMISFDYRPSQSNPSCSRHF
jgi:hypothetical protein